VISPDHLAMLAKSGIAPAYAACRGYETVHDKARLGQLKFVQDVRDHSGLLIPLRRGDSSVWGHQFRPDSPRMLSGRPVKYETPWQQPNGLDVPVGFGPMLGDPSTALWVTEGSKKTDCLALHGICAVGLIGVWNWIETNTAGGKMALAAWRDCALNGRRVIVGFDGDVARKPAVRKAMSALAAYLTYKGAKVEYAWLPDTPNKTGVDDFLMDGHTIADLWALVNLVPPPENRKPQPPPAPAPKPAPLQAVSLDEAHTVFHRWLGADYDTDALDAMLAAAAVEKFDDGSDPVWLLIVSGPGAAKTETVQACDGIGAIITSAITGEAALLSATPKRDRAKTATGGLLRRIGDRGLLVVKDVTSLLSMNTDTRDRVLAAMREVFDGRWYREVGSDGGSTLEWKGRIVVIGAVTTAWDTHHAVLATMGDRFTLVRIDSTVARIQSGRRAVGNTGDETKMRAELAAAVGGVIAGMNKAPITVTDEETETLLKAADLVTLARTGVEYDRNGGVIDAHAPEMPTRFAKQLTQIVRGGVAIGMDRKDALRLAIRCARDSMPPLRLAIVDDLSAVKESTSTEVRKRLEKPRTTVDRQLQALHILGVCRLREEEIMLRKRWYYSLAPNIDSSALVVPDKLVPQNPPHTPNPSIGKVQDQGSAQAGPVICGGIYGTNPGPSIADFFAS
jgi:hypothetical protein